nr:hypothetical protein [Neisseria musculi]
MVIPRPYRSEHSIGFSDGKSQARAALYMPASAAYRMNAFPAFIGRLKAGKKPPKLIYCCNYAKAGNHRFLHFEKPNGIRQNPLRINNIN